MTARKNTSARSRPEPKSPPPRGRAGLDRREIQQRIRMAAYFKYLERGRRPGGHLEDWKEAEREINSRL